MSRLRGGGPAGFSDGAVLLNGIDTVAEGARDQRAQCQLAPHAILAQGIAWRRVRMLFRAHVTAGQQRKKRIEELSQEPTVDDLPLSRCR
jgi:hypothetical protein